jgi:hypothetical protein
LTSEKTIFYLEVALADPKDKWIYAFNNVSHIPTAKLVEVFEIDLQLDPYILEGYFLTKQIYKKHKAFLDKELGSLNFKVFEYCLRRYSAKEADIRSMYKKDLWE